MVFISLSEQYLSHKAHYTNVSSYFIISAWDILLLELIPLHRDDYIYDMQWYAGECLATGCPGENPLFVVLAIFHGVNVPTMAYFKLLV